MKAKRCYILLGCIPFVGMLHAQTLEPTTQVHQLEEVVVSDIRLKRYTAGHKVTTLTDSTIKRNGTFLTSLLHFNSHIYFKENGLGMVSSPAFRGTNASHTAVVWNGININSQLNGQVDFNTVNPLNYGTVAIRSGGGSVQFGSGAIGGTVHLNNDLNFAKHGTHQLLMAYGSFDTRSLNYSNSFGGNKWATTFGVNYNSSDNDYRYLQTNQRNTNGELEHLNLNFNGGYIINDRQVLRWYHQSFIGDRNLSGTLVAPGRSRYKDHHYRSQLDWSAFGDKLSHRIKIAHLHDAFTYYENKDSAIFTEGRVTTLLARYNLDLALSDAIRLNSFVEYNNYSSKGSNFGTPTRNDLAITALLKHQLTNKLQYNVSLRQDFSSDFASAPVFALDGSYNFNKLYTLQLNASRNFRLPTFNDLYWQPGGNLELRPENSYQLDVGHQLRIKPFTFQLNTYWINTKDMIRWLPNLQGLWSPTNVDQVQIYGAEVSVAYQQNISKKQQLDVRVNYAYTVSEDKASGQQQIYVPLHRANAALAYNLSNFGMYYQQLYNGAVPIIGGELDGYLLANTGVNYRLKSSGKLQYRIGIHLNNLFNTYYENIALRPMPNRNIQTQIVLNF